MGCLIISRPRRWYPGDTRKSTTSPATWAVSQSRNCDKRAVSLVRRRWMLASHERADRDKPPFLTAHSELSSPYIPPTRLSYSSVVCLIPDLSGQEVHYGPFAHLHITIEALFRLMRSSQDFPVFVSPPWCIFSVISRFHIFAHDPS